MTVEFLLDDWTHERISAATSFVRERVLSDVATAGLEREWVGELLAFRMEDGEMIGIAFGDEHSFPIHLDDGPEKACALTADELQDGVIDRLGRPWPELLGADGTFVGVLDVAVRDGIACWVLRGVSYCAVGQLAGGIGAAGHRLAGSAGEVGE